MLVHFIRSAQLHRVQVLAGTFTFLVFVISFWRKKRTSTISWRVIIDTQKQGKANDNGPHSMVRSMWLLLELLWQNCCHHPVDTKKPRGHVIPWPLPRSPLFRTTTGQKRERETKQVVRIPLFPAALVRFQQLVHRILFYGNVFVHDRCHHHCRWKWITPAHMFIRERDHTSCAYCPPATLVHFQQLEHRI